MVILMNKIAPTYHIICIKGISSGEIFTQSGLKMQDGRKKTQLLVSFGSARQCGADRPRPPIPDLCLDEEPFDVKAVKEFQVEENLKALLRQRQLLPGTSNLFVLKLVSMRSTGVEVLREDIRNLAEQNNLLSVILPKTAASSRKSTRKTHSHVVLVVKGTLGNSLQHHLEFHETLHKHKLKPQRVSDRLKWN